MTSVFNPLVKKGFDEVGTGGGAVDSVNGQTGAVVLDAADVGAEPTKGTDDNYVTDAEKANLHAPGSDDQDLSSYLTSAGAASTYQPLMGADDNYVTDAEKANLHAPGSDDQDLSGYVPFTGATTDVDLSGVAVTADALYVTGGTAFLYNDGAFAFYSDAGITATGNIFNSGVGLYNFLDPTTGLSAIFDTTGITTADKTFTLPDATGTIALTSDITGTNSGTNTGDQDLSGYALLSGATFTGDVVVNDMIFDESANRLGIGTLTPASPLHVVGSGLVTGSINYINQLYDSRALASGIGGGLLLGGTYTSGGSVVAGGGIDLYKEDATSGNYSFALRLHTRATGGLITEKMRITSDGKVGIGTYSPSSNLTVDSSGDTAIQVNSSTTSGLPRFIFGNASNYYDLRIDGTTASFVIRDISAGNLDRITLLNNGRVGIGVTPDIKFQVDGTFGSSGGSSALKMYDRTNGAAHAWGMYSDSNIGRIYSWGKPGDVMYFTEAGRVGIGTSAPNSLLEVLGDIYLSGGADNRQLLVNSTTSRLVMKGGTDASDSYLEFQAYNYGGAGAGGLGYIYAKRAIQFNQNGTLVFNAQGGKVAIGSATAATEMLYVTGNIYTTATMSALTVTDRP